MLNRKFMLIQELPRRGGALKGGSWSSPDIYQHKLEVGCVGVMLGAIVESLWKNEFGFWKIRFW